MHDDPVERLPGLPLRIDRAGFPDPPSARFCDLPDKRRMAASAPLRAFRPPGADPIGRSLSPAARQRSCRYRVSCGCLEPGTPLRTPRPIRSCVRRRLVSPADQRPSGTESQDGEADHRTQTLQRTLALGLSRHLEIAAHLDHLGSVDCPASHWSAAQLTAYDSDPLASSEFVRMLKRLDPSPRWQDTALLAVNHADRP